MSNQVLVPTKVIDGVRWAELSLVAEHHLICGEIVKKKDENFTIAGQHRVRLYSFKKNVHWRPAGGISLDVAAVPPANPPRRPQHR
jgi:hypothetical protein